MLNVNVGLDSMVNENPHNKRYRLIMAGYFADWFSVEAIWMDPRKMAASREAGAALDDFLQQHSSQNTDKTKE